MKLSFGFAKKAAAPKKVAVQMKEEGKKIEKLENISDVLEKQKEEKNEIVIPCKNLIKHQPAIDQAKVTNPLEEAQKKRTGGLIGASGKIKT